MEPRVLNSDITYVLSPLWCDYVWQIIMKLEVRETPNALNALPPTPQQQQQRQQQQQQQQQQMNEKCDSI